MSDDVIKNLNVDRRGDKKGIFSLREASETSTSPRALLANALESVAQTPHERQRLQEYRATLEQMNAQEQRLRELNAQIKEMTFSSEMLALQYFFTIHYCLLLSKNRRRDLVKSE